MYKTIIFDLDDTLTDNLENVRYAFKKVLEYKKEKYTEEKFSRFCEIDERTWADRAKGILITPYEDDKVKKAEWLRASRFIKYFGEENITYNEAVRVNNIYMNGMKEVVVPQEGAYELIKYLYDKKYKIVIATNGPIIPLKSKIEKLGIQKFIDTIFASEEVGYMKPHFEYFEGLLKKAKVKNKDKILFVGDDLEKDIKGSIDYNIDVCWCNYKNKTNNKYKINYEIYKLSELKNIL